ncbi:MAG: hypothetical protein EA414_00100 [Arthrospira sp. PLM2.Bin9]|nr:hypothetical protein [Arthrospira sp. PLM2.Bin9]TVU55742.1 MAG: hypothetical protein EA414_00100 [Arthrospira sp. PLM2.Bin9]
MSPSPNKFPQVPDSPPIPPQPGVDQPEAESSLVEQIDDAAVPNLTENTPLSTPDNHVKQLSDEDDGLVHPIPPPSEPRQYRAIGLVRGCYHASGEQFTQGILRTVEGAEIDAVLLGRVMSLVKKHIDLEAEHLWVVYPRTRQKQDDLHVQIMGVWEPQTLTKSNDDSMAVDKISPDISPDNQALPDIEHGYFSIRGEIVYQSQDDPQYAIVKIRQSSRNENEKPKFFKLKLLGMVGLRPVGHFIDLHARLIGSDLVVEESHDIGALPIKGKRPFKPGKPRGSFPRSPRPDTKPRRTSASGSPTPKPIPRKSPKTQD